MKINNKEERQLYFENIIGEDIGSYFIVTFNNHTEAIYISNLGKGFGDDNRNYYLEYPTQLYTYEIRDKKDRRYWKKYADIIRGNIAYEIMSFQVFPFLPEVIDDIKQISTEECLDYLLAKA